ncbi:hypothetical protein WR25_00688 [Diploscapter pachys]|uniref:Aminopeptidase N-like N-terminal domain-containing protein n=1 Tax=Diploscapter pachys TaxID=2018661 RepID=A0A2A2J9S2_9BILA|nr:hypothetical protein WR25_00688 [Diploscapter pachys]
MRAAPILIRLFFCWTLIFTVQAGEDGLFKHPKIISHLERQRVRKDAIQSRLNILYSNPMRLPSTLVANHYDIHLKPYYPAPGISYDPSRNFTFDGDVSMQVTVVASTNVFVVNANRLNFSSITVTDGNGNNLNVGSTS